MRLSHENCALRFVVDAELVQQIWNRAKGLQQVAGKRKTSALRLRYLDTPDYSLEQADISLWLQCVRRHWTQTFEIGTTPQGGLSIGDRFQNTAPQGQPNIDAIVEPSVRDEVNHRVNGSPLVPVCEAVIKRSSVELSPDGESRAQLTIESSDILAAGRSAMLCEAEIALLAGRPGVLFDLTHILFPAGGSISRSSPRWREAIFLPSAGTSIRRSNRTTPRKSCCMTMRASKRLPTTF